MLNMAPGISVGQELIYMFYPFDIHNPTTKKNTLAGKNEWIDDIQYIIMKDRAALERERMRIRR